MSDGRDGYEFRLDEVIDCLDEMIKRLDLLSSYLDPRPRVVRDTTCNKVPHVGAGYLHGEDDDTPYLVDGLWYCGRCHRNV